MIIIESSTPSCFLDKPSLYEAAIWLADPEQDNLRRLANTLAEARADPLSAAPRLMAVDVASSAEAVEKVLMCLFLLRHDNSYMKLLLQGLYEMMLQELKVLFLRTRNNSDALYWSVISQIYKRQTFAETKANGTFAKAGIFFNSLRDKYNRALKDLVKSYKTKYR